MKLRIFILVFMLFRGVLAGAGAGAGADSDQLSYVGVVDLYTTAPRQDSKFYFLGSAVFIESDTLVTAGHVLYDLRKLLHRGYLLSFAHPETGEMEPIIGHHAINMWHDFALLKTKFKSKVFYPLVDGDQSIKKGEDIIVVGFPDGYFKVAGGHILNQYDYVIEGSMFYNGPILGFSGGAVFHAETGQLIAMIAQGESQGVFFRAIPHHLIKAQLLSEPQNCLLLDCMNNQIDKILAQAIEGSSPAQYRIGHLLSKMISENNDPEEEILASSIFKLCPEKEKRDRDICREQQAVHFLRQSALNKKPYMPAFLDLCFLGIRSQWPTSKSLSLCEMSARKGNVMAMSSLGNLYYHGSDGFVDQDYHQAYYWFSEAKDNGDIWALLFLGLMQLTGKGTPQDPNLALCSLQQAHAFLKRPQTQSTIDQLIELGYSCESSQDKKGL